MSHTHSVRLLGEDASRDYAFRIAKDHIILVEAKRQGSGSLTAFLPEAVSQAIALLKRTGLVGITPSRLQLTHEPLKQLQRSALLSLQRTGMDFLASSGVRMGSNGLSIRRAPVILLQSL